MTARRRGPLLRWVLPLGIVWSGVLLSAWVYTERLAPAAVGPRAVGLLWGGPVLTLAVWGALRAYVDRHDRDPVHSADGVLLWVVLFLSGLHGTALAAAVGLIPSLDRAVPVGVAVLDIGLAFVLLTLAPGSVAGLRTAATLSSARSWKRAHRWAAACLGSAGVASLTGLLTRGWWSWAYAAVPSMVAVAVATAFAHVVPRRVERAPGTIPVDPGEQDGNPDRP